MNGSTPRVLCKNCCGEDNLSFGLLNENAPCFNCIGLISHVSMAFISSEIQRCILTDFPNEIVHFNINLPPVLDLPRIVIKETCRGFSRLRKMSEVLQASIVSCNPQIIVGEKEVAGVVMDIDVAVPIELQEILCRAVNNSFRSKKRKRVITYGNEPAPPEVLNVTCFDVENLCIIMKNLKGDDRNALLKRWSDVVQSLTIAGAANTSTDTSIIPSVGIQEALFAQFTWKVSAARVPIFIMGRYLKYARDVPQSPWFLEEDDDGASPSGGYAVNPAEANNIDSSMNTNSNSSENDTVDPTCRKGRASVEEIFSAAVCLFLQAQKCNLHACGREDIDVRMLGNGRPFVCRVVGAKIVPTAVLLDQLTEYINGKQGLNSSGDVAVAVYCPPLMNTHKTSLAHVDETVWKNMQAKAEEKLKAYQCVIHSSHVITPSVLKELELLTDSGCGNENASTSANPVHLHSAVSLSSKFLSQITQAQLQCMKEAEKEERVTTRRPMYTSTSSNSLNNAATSSTGIDTNANSNSNSSGYVLIPEEERETMDALKEMGPGALKIYQRTPLRVLHRRSLLTRTRYISSLQTTYINPHTFIMTVVTTAGTYVKELVHGDNNRTIPSIASLFNCPVHMLQLDVIYLFDDFYSTIQSLAGASAADDDALYKLSPIAFNSRNPLLDRHWNILNPTHSTALSTPDVAVKAVTAWQEVSWVELQRVSSLGLSTRNYQLSQNSASVSTSSSSSAINSTSSIASIHNVIHDLNNMQFNIENTQCHLLYEIVPIHKQSVSSDPSQEVFNITHTFVEEKFRGSGLGLYLCDVALKYAADCGYLLWNSPTVASMRSTGDVRLSETCWYADVAYKKLNP